MNEPASNPENHIKSTYSSLALAMAFLNGLSWFVMFNFIFISLVSFNFGLYYTTVGLIVSTSILGTFFSLKGIARKERFFIRYLILLYHIASVGITLYLIDDTYSVF